MKLASLEKRRRACVICGAEFFVLKTSQVGKTCSKPCNSAHLAKVKTGTRQSAETKAKRSQSLRALRADPDRNAAWTAAAAEGVREWHRDPENALFHATASSERMKRRHTEPEFQKRRDARSSRTMKATWEKHREEFTAQALERYLRHRADGLGLWSQETIERKNIAARWIMKQAQEALRLETNYNDVFTEVQARLRREMPYEGPTDGSDYLEYCQKLGTATASSPECHAVADPFLSEAIPRFGEEWQRRKRDARDQG